MTQPACFGFLATLDVNSNTCSNCRFKSDCIDQAYSRGLEIQKEIKIDSELTQLRPHVSESLRVTPWSQSRRMPHRAPSRKKALKPTAMQVSMMMQMPSSLKQVCTQIFKKGIDVEASLMSSINPFENHKPEFMRVACNLAIKCQGSFTKRQLREELQRELSWSGQSAKAKAWVAIQVLQVFGLERHVNGSYQLRRIAA